MKNFRHDFHPCVYNTQYKNYIYLTMTIAEKLFKTLKLNIWGHQIGNSFFWFCCTWSQHENLFIYLTGVFAILMNISLIESINWNYGLIQAEPREPRTTCMYLKDFHTYSGRLTGHCTGIACYKLTNQRWIWFYFLKLATRYKQVWTFQHKKFGTLLWD